MTRTGKAGGFATASGVLDDVLAIAEPITAGAEPW